MTSDTRDTSHQWSVAGSAASQDPGQGGGRLNSRHSGSGCEGSSSVILSPRTGLAASLTPIQLVPSSPTSHTESQCPLVSPPRAVTPLTPTTGAQADRGCSSEATSNNSVRRIMGGLVSIVSIAYDNCPSLMIIASASQFHIYLPWCQRQFSIVS